MSSEEWSHSKSLNLLEEMHPPHLSLLLLMNNTCLFHMETISSSSLLPSWLLDDGNNSEYSPSSEWSVDHADPKAREANEG